VKDGLVLVDHINTIIVLFLSYVGVNAMSNQSNQIVLRKCDHKYCLHCGGIIHFNVNLWYRPDFCSDDCSHREYEKVYGKTIHGEPLPTKINNGD